MQIDTGQPLNWHLSGTLPTNLGADVGMSTLHIYGNLALSGTIAST